MDEKKLEELKKLLKNYQPDPFVLLMVRKYKDNPGKLTNMILNSIYN